MLLSLEYLIASIIGSIFRSLFAPIHMADDAFEKLQQHINRVVEESP